MPTFTPTGYPAILLSLKASVAAAFLPIPFGFDVARLMMYRKFHGKTTLDVIVNFPLTLPHGGNQLPPVDTPRAAGVDKEI
jgi:molybdate transport system permease protein